MLRLVPPRIIWSREETTDLTSILQDQFYSFGIINTGPGLEYHAALAECSPPKLKRSLAMTLEDVPSPRLQDSSFWFLLYRQLVYPKKTNGAEEVYTVLLPYLNGKPIYSNAVAAKKGIER